MGWVFYTLISGQPTLWAVVPLTTKYHISTAFSSLIFPLPAPPLCDILTPEQPCCRVRWPLSLMMEVMSMDKKFDFQDLMAFAACLFGFGTFLLALLTFVFAFS